MSRSPERLALDERHDVVEQALGLARVVEAEDVGVLEVGGDPDLAEEAVGAERGGELGAEHLDGDRPLVLEVLGEVDRGHAAFADLALDVVAISQRGSESVDRSGQMRGLGAGRAMLQDKPASGEVSSRPSPA